MTLTTTVDKRERSGHSKIVKGHCTSDSTGGNINTGLHVVDQFFVTCQGGSVAGNAPSIDETFPLVDTAVTVVTDSSQSFTWTAIGR